MTDKKRRGSLFDDFDSLFDESGGFLSDFGRRAKERMEAFGRKADADMQKFVRERDKRFEEFGRESRERLGSFFDQGRAFPEPAKKQIEPEKHTDEETDKLREELRKSKEAEARAKEAEAREKRKREKAEERYRTSEHQRKQSEQAKTQAKEKAPKNKIERAYQVLGLSPDASKAEIKQRYQNLSLAHHPDRYGKTPRLKQQAEEEMKEINEAYDVLRRHLRF